MPTVLITGVGGYFGRVAQNFFRGKGWQVIGAGRKAGSDVALDLDEPERIAALQFPCAVDVIIHAAAAHEISCAQRPLRAAAQNVIATLALLDAAIRNKVPRFVYLSTFHVFGEPAGRMIETTPPSPTNIYGLTHLQCEQAVEMNARLGRLQGISIRPANFFGLPPSLAEFDRWTLTPFAFLREGLETGRIVLKTPGRQRRNFVSVESVCRLIYQQLAHTSPYLLLHSTGAETYSIRELAVLAQEALRAQGREVAVAFPEGENQTPSFSFDSLIPQPAPELTMPQFLGQLAAALLAGAHLSRP